MTTTVVAITVGTRCGAEGEGFGQGEQGRIRERAGVDLAEGDGDQGARDHAEQDRDAAEEAATEHRSATAATPR
ncbi:hypothetical protein [Streptomyces sp. NPDC002394]